MNKKTKLPIPANPTIEKFVYDVPSEVNPKICYRVDIVANGGAGHCNCVDFGTRRQPALDAGKPALHQQTTCKHVRKAFWQFLRDIMPKLARIEERK